MHTTTTKPFPTKWGRLHESNITRKMHNFSFRSNSATKKKKISISRSHFTYHAYWLQWVGNKKNGAIEFETNDPKGRDIMLSRTRLTISIIFREKKLNEKYLFWQNWGGTSMHSPHLHALFSTRVNKTKLSSFYRLHWASFAIKSFRDSSFIDFF